MDHTHRAPTDTYIPPTIVELQDVLEKVTRNYNYYSWDFDMDEIREDRTWRIIYETVKAAYELAKKQHQGRRESDVSGWANL